MKNLFLGFAALSLLLLASSCTGETVETVDQLKGQIGFKAAISKQTFSRASEFTGWAPLSGELSVYSYPVNSDVLFHKFDLTSPDGLAWSYSPAVNQPGNQLRYYSWYPETHVVNYAPTATDYSFEYTVLPSAGQEDLIGATSSTLQSTVTLEFRHLLSQVNFAVQGQFGVEIGISNISVNGVKNSGKYSFNNGWSYLPATPSTDNYPYTPLVSALDLLSAGTTGNVVYLGNGNGIYNNNNALMLLPQSFAAESDGTFSFDFTLRIDEDGDGLYDGPTDTDISESAVVSFNVFETNEWKSGKRYVYVIDFSSYLSGGPIVFNVRVADWVDWNNETGGNGNVIQTLNVAEASAFMIEKAIANHSATNASTGGTVFPIAVTQELTAPITLTHIPGFDAGDQIRIQFPSSASLVDGDGDASNGTDLFNIDLLRNGWTISTEGTRVIILTCVDPILTSEIAAVVTVVPESVGSVDTITLNAINAAIAAQAATSVGDATLQEFPITVPLSFDAIDISSIAGFASGMRIVFTCPDAASATNLTLSDGGWTRVQYGKVVIFKKPF